MVWLREYESLLADLSLGGYFPWLKLSLNDRHILATTDRYIMWLSAIILATIF